MHPDLFFIEDKLQERPLPANLSGHRTVIKQYKFFVPSTSKAKERFQNRLRKPLEHLLGTNDTDELLHFIDEGLSNAQEHAHHNNPTKNTLVELYIIDKKRLTMSMQYETVEFNPAQVRTSPRNPDGSIYMEPRGRGHIMMKSYSDVFVYPREFENGKCYSWGHFYVKRINPETPSHQTATQTVM